MNADPLKLAMEFAVKAVKADQSNNAAQAIKSYDLTINYLTQAVADPKNAAQLPAIKQKISEYSARRDVVRASLPANAQAHADDPNADRVAGSFQKLTVANGAAGGGVDNTPAPVPTGGAAAAAPTPAALPAENINEILKSAFAILEKARRCDAMGEFPEALKRYTEALENFLKVYQQEQNPDLKEQLKQTIMKNTDRAEELKRMIQQQQQAAKGLDDPSEKRRAFNAIRNRHQDGPYEQTVRLSHPGYSGMVEMTVKVPKQEYVQDEKVPFFLVVDNQSGRAIESIKVYLKCTVDTYKWNGGSSSTQNREKLRLLKRTFRFGNVFPLEHGLRYEGDSEYELGPHLKPTARDDPGVYSREYVMVVKCWYKGLWKDLKAYIPIEIKEK